MILACVLQRSYMIRDHLALRVEASFYTVARVRSGRRSSDREVENGYNEAYYNPLGFQAAFWHAYASDIVSPARVRG